MHSRTESTLSKCQSHLVLIISLAASMFSVTAGSSSLASWSSSSSSTTSTTTATPAARLVEVMAANNGISLSTTMQPSAGATAQLQEPTTVSAADGDDEWTDVVMLWLKASIMILIIVAAIFGNLLVIVSVMRNRKLR